MKILKLVLFIALFAITPTIIFSQSTSKKPEAPGYIPSKASNENHDKTLKDIDYGDKAKPDASPSGGNSSGASSNSSSGSSSIGGGGNSGGNSGGNEHDHLSAGDH
jgi:hypothetical protein